MNPIIMLFVFLLLSSIAAYIPWNERVVRLVGVGTSVLALAAAIWLAVLETPPAISFYARGLFVVTSLNSSLLVLTASLLLILAITSYERLGQKHQEFVISLKNLRHRYALFSLATLFLCGALLANHVAILWASLQGMVLVITALVTLFGKSADKSLAQAYGLFTSLGLLIALFGMLLIEAGLGVTGATLAAARLVAVDGPQLTVINQGFLTAGFILAFLGLSVPMGLAPWNVILKKTAEQAPSHTAVLLTAILSPVAFYSLLILRPLVGEHDLIFLTFGLLSLAISVIQLLCAKSTRSRAVGGLAVYLSLMTFAVGLGPAAVIPVILILASMMSVGTLVLLGGERLGFLFLAGLPLSPFFASTAIIYGYGLNQQPWWCLVAVFLMVIAAVGLLKQFTTVKSEPASNLSPLTRACLIALTLATIAGGIWFLTPDAITRAVTAAQLVSSQ